MRLIGGYVTRTVAAALLLVLLVILGLDGIAAVIDELEDLRDSYTFSTALAYVGLSLPARIYEYLPFVALVGCLAGLGTLAGTSELVAMRSAGTSVLRLSWFAIKPALWLTLAGLVIAEFVAPKSQQLADSYRAMALRDASVVSEFGLWHREGDRFMHFNAVQPNGVLYGVSEYRFDGRRQLQRSLFAARATYQAGGYWWLEDGRETRFEADRTVSATFGGRRWETGLTPDLLNLLVLRADDLSISGLWQYADYLHDQGLNADEYRLAFWNKVLQPFAITGMVLLAVSCVFGPLRQSTMGFRIFVGVLIGVVFSTSQDMLGPASLVYGFPPLLAAAVPALASGLAGVVLLRRAA